MLHIGNKNNEPDTLQATYVYHPQSDALEKKMKQMLADELSLFGLISADYHDIRNDMEFIREMRCARKRTIAFTAKAALFGAVSIIGSLLTAGFYAIVQRGQP